MNFAKPKRVFDALLRDKAQALLVFPEARTLEQSKLIADFGKRHRLPSIFGWKEYVGDGGLMSYGPDRDETFRSIARYVDKIIKGTKPADLPVEQPMRFELLFNLKTAKQIGVTIAPNVLVRANRVIR